MWLSKAADFRALRVGNNRLGENMETPLNIFK